jgi:glycosyltransferase involved in cell wall biosynthesis
LTPPPAGAPAPASPHVSVVIPALDVAEHIGASIESVLAQTHQPLEVIVVVDGPDNATADAVAAFGAPVRMIRRETTEGPATARNRGIREARAGLIAFNDSDDLWLPEKLERQVAAFRANPDLGCSLTRLELFWEDEVAWEEDAVREAGRADGVPGYATITMLAPRSTFERVGLLDEDRWHSDAVEWLMRVREAGLEIEMIDEVLVRHRRRPDSLSREADRGSREFLALVRERLAKRQGQPKP